MLLAARPDPDVSHSAQMSPEFEHLRWFELPQRCVS